MSVLCTHHHQLAIPERRHPTCCIPHGQGIQLHGPRFPHVSAAGVSEDPVLSTDRSGAWLSVSGVMAAMAACLSNSRHLTPLCFSAHRCPCCVHSAGNILRISVSQVEGGGGGGGDLETVVV